MNIRFIYFLCILLGSPVAQAEPATVSERDMKAALIYNFAVFTAWPESRESAFNVCVFDEDKENLNRDILRSKQINGKPVHFEVIFSIGEVQKCQLLYLEDSKNKEDKMLLESMVNFSVLSIADTMDKMASASIINIHLDNKKYKFTVNNEAAKRSNLTVSSKLLRLATKVY